MEIRLPNKLAAITVLLTAVTATVSAHGAHNHGSQMHNQGLISGTEHMTGLGWLATSWPLIGLAFIFLVSGLYYLHRNRDVEG